MKTSPKTTTWWYSGGSNKAIDLVYYKYLIGRSSWRKYTFINLKMTKMLIVDENI